MWKATERTRPRTKKGRGSRRPQSPNRACPTPLASDGFEDTPITRQLSQETHRRRHGHTQSRTPTRGMNAVSGSRSQP
jgi:hypothetical protein